MANGVAHPEHEGASRFELAVREVLAAVEALAPSQSFCVLVHSSSFSAMFGSLSESGMVEASPEAKHRLRDWFGLLTPEGQREECLEALRQVLRLEPDMVLLLSDGDWHATPEELERLVLRPGANLAPVHAVVIGGPVGTAMKALTRKTGGEYLELFCITPRVTTLTPEELATGLLRRATLAQQRGRPRDAQRHLQVLARDYPHTHAARLARERLRFVTP